MEPRTAAESASPESPAGDDAAPRRLELRYRAWAHAVPPRRIKLALPGWAGDPGQEGEGARPQPWHCQPFVDGSTYGLELVYPFETECRVTRGDDGAVRFEGDFTPEMERMQAEGTPMNYPFGTFAPGHYGLTSTLDILAPPGHVLRIEPHPRFFTDDTGTVPVAVPGHIQPFWPRMFFVVFKAPRPGEEHVFRRGEPYAQLLVVPASAGYTLEAMEEGEAGDRQRQNVQIGTLQYLLAKHIWHADNGLWFDDKYKQLLRIYRTSGLDGVRRHLDALELLATPRRQREPQGGGNDAGPAE